MRVLISAGPTREKIDPVRFISNRSSGRMGYALAEAAQQCGAQVTLVSGPVNLTPPAGVEVINVESAAEMAAAVHANAPQADVIIMAAAVADYRPAQPIDEKMKKSPGALFLELERTEDILATLGKNKTARQTLMGFAAETNDLEKSALGKLQRKNLDWIAANLVADGFGQLTDTFVVFNRRGDRFELPCADKKLQAVKLLELLGIK